MEQMVKVIEKRYLSEKSKKINFPHSLLRKLIKDVLQKNKEVSQERRRCGIQETVELRREEKGIPKMISGQASSGSSQSRL